MRNRDRPSLAIHVDITRESLTDVIGLWIYGCLELSNCQ